MASTTNPEQDPAPRPKRRTFPAEYKLRIVAEYDAAPNGEKGAILRREGGRLRLADVARLEAVCVQDWTRWRLTALAVVTAAIEDATGPNRDAADTRIGLRAPQWWRDDLTWYQGDLGIHATKPVAGPGGLSPQATAGGRFTLGSYYARNVGGRA